VKPFPFKLKIKEERMFERNGSTDCSSKENFFEAQIYLRCSASMIGDEKGIHWILLALAMPNGSTDCSPRG